MEHSWRLPQHPNYFQEAGEDSTNPRLLLYAHVHIFRSSLVLFLPNPKSRWQLRMATQHKLRALWTVTSSLHRGLAQRPWLSEEGSEYELHETPRVPRGQQPVSRL